MTFYHSSFQPGFMYYARIFDGLSIYVENVLAILHNLDPTPFPCFCRSAQKCANRVDLCPRFTYNISILSSRVEMEPETASIEKGS